MYELLLASRILALGTGLGFYAENNLLPDKIPGNTGPGDLDSRGENAAPPGHGTGNYEGRRGNVRYI